LADVPGTQCNVSSEPVTGIGMVGRLTSQRSRRAWAASCPRARSFWESQR